MSNPVSGETQVTVKYGTGPNDILTGVFVSFDARIGAVYMFSGGTYYLCKNYICASYDKPTP